jgi:hypothetical protein
MKLFCEENIFIFDASGQNYNKQKIEKKATFQKVIFHKTTFQKRLF